MVAPLAVGNKCDASKYLIRPPWFRNSVLGRSSANFCAEESFLTVKRYENCWPAFAKDTQGIVFVYSSDQKNVSTALDVWYNNFVQSQGVRDSQCVVFCHRKSSDRPAGNPSQLSHLFARITWVSTNIDDTEDGGKGGEQTRHEFNKFLERLSNELNERHDQEELSIIGQA
ncbi:hypothetical protein HPB49_000642 [Dermacentor silvarum]|uniref:Uncharacterized protein n=1 Tax=Dermacentor silvarum TaxID=543639 RepID=A0ACB8D1A0_DERSI|nr:hypothetical protein HPB49_000642 [Dermacentor silvarum]